MHHASAVVAARKKGAAADVGSEAQDRDVDDKYRKRGVGELFTALGFSSPAGGASGRRDEAAMAEEGAIDTHSHTASAASARSTSARRSSRPSGALCTPRRFLLVFVLLFAVSTAVMLIATLTAAPADNA